MLKQWQLLELTAVKMIKRSFQDLKHLHTFEERFNYLKLSGVVGQSIFGFDRYMNQVFYKSKEWIKARDLTILRDEGRDLGIPGYEIRRGFLVHHMNPISLDDLDPINPEILEPEFLITTIPSTHQALHYGDNSLLSRIPKKRFPGDTKLW